MAVIVFRCTDCDREIQIIEQPTGLETIGRCIITNKCRGNLYRIGRKEDFVVGEFPQDVRGLTNWIKRNVVFDHTQGIADITWTVVHNLGVNPSVQVVVDREIIVDGVVTTTRIEIEPQLITLIDENTLTIQFDRPESGLAQIIARSTAATQSVEAITAPITYLPITTNGIMTIAVNIDSLQFPAGSTANTCIVRMYILDQETLNETAFASAVYKDFTATLPVSTSAWSDVDEIFVNGVTYTVLTIDIGDPVTDFGAPSAGTVLFQAGTSTTDFTNDQAPNMVVLLSASPHNNADKIRNQVFRPDLEVGPVQTLDSFIFASGEYFLDQTKVEKVFPPIYIVDAPQSHSTVPVVAEGAYVLAFGMFDGTIPEGSSYGTQYISDNDITTWTGGIFPEDLTFLNPRGAIYASAISTWVMINSSTTSPQVYSTDDGVSWGFAPRVDSFTTASNSRSTNCAWSPTLSLFAAGANNGQIQISSDGITWANATDTPRTSGVFAFDQILSIHWSETLALFFCGTSNNQVGTSVDGDTWVVTATEPGGAGSNDIDVIHSVGSRVFVGRDNGTVFYSDNSGASWTQSVIAGVAIGSADPGGFAANADGSIIVMGAVGINNAEYIWRSTDSGVNFTSVDVAVQLGITNLHSHSLLYDADYGFVQGGRNADTDGHIIMTSVDGLTWVSRLEEQLQHPSGGVASPLSGSPILTDPQHNDFTAIASKNQVLD